MLKSKNGKACEGKIPRWADQNMDKLNGSQICLLDEPKYWKTVGLPVTKILNNGRLTKLMNAPRNRIVKLPLPLDLAMQFCCANCNQIPFPWAPVPRSSLGSEKTYSQAVFLCKEGHPICRSCYESFCRCVFNEVDYNFSYPQTESTQKSCASDSVRQQTYLQSVPFNFGMWEDANICLMQKSAFKCMFLTNMIRSAEFPCKNFVKGCSFRGRASLLQTHGENCDRGLPLQLVVNGESQVATFSDDDGTKDYESHDKDNDNAILKLKMDDIVSEAHQIILSSLEKYEEQIAVHKLQGEYAYEQKRFKYCINGYISYID